MKNYCIESDEKEFYIEAESFEIKSDFIIFRDVDKNEIMIVIAKNIICFYVI